MLIGYVSVYVLLKFIPSCNVQITHSTTSSTLYINATDTNATIHNGLYTCQVTLTIAGVDRFNKFSDNSRVALRGSYMPHILYTSDLILCISLMYIESLPPTGLSNIGVATSPYLAYITWVVEFIVFDTEVYSVQYGTDMSLQDSSQVVMGSSDGLVTNQVFSVNITGLTPFITYYYIVWANNSVGNTKTSIMSFTTNETGKYVSIKTKYNLCNCLPSST